MSKATETELSGLHRAVAAAFASSLGSHSEAQRLLVEYSDELPDEVRDFLLGIETPSPAILTAATKFLKDNNITCAIEDSPELSEVEKSLAEKRAVRGANVVPFDEAFV